MIAEAEGDRSEQLVLVFGSWSGFECFSGGAEGEGRTFGGPPADQAVDDVVSNEGGLPGSLRGEELLERSKGMDRMLFEGPPDEQRNEGIGRIDVAQEERMQDGPSLSRGQALGRGGQLSADGNVGIRRGELGALGGERGGEIV